MFVGPLIHPRYLSRRSKPYERPQRSTPKPTTNATATQSGAEQAATTTRQESPGSNQPDAATITRLFQLLVPIMVKEPLAFESKASAICLALELDPTAATDIINAVKQNMPGGSKAE
jgi:hypothetical protein